MSVGGCCALTLVLQCKPEDHPIGRCFKLVLEVVLHTTTCPGPGDFNNVFHEGHLSFKQSVPG